MRKTVIAVVCALALALSFALAGCGGKSTSEDEMQIRALIDQQFSVENLSLDDAAVFFGEDAEIFDSLGIDVETLTDTLFEGYSYEVTKVDIDKDGASATADLTITCKDYSTFAGSFMAKFTEYFAGISSMPSEEELYKAVGTIITDSLAEVGTDKLVTGTMTVGFVKTEEGWAINDAAAVSSTFSNIVFGPLIEGLNALQSQ